MTTDDTRQVTVNDAGEYFNSLSGSILSKFYKLQTGYWVVYCQSEGVMKKYNKAPGFPNPIMLTRGTGIVLTIPSQFHPNQIFRENGFSVTEYDFPRTQKVV